MCDKMPLLSWVRSLRSDPDNTDLLSEKESWKKELAVVRLRGPHLSSSEQGLEQDAQQTGEDKSGGKGGESRMQGWTEGELIAHDE